MTKYGLFERENPLMVDYNAEGCIPCTAQP